MGLKGRVHNHPALTVHAPTLGVDNMAKDEHPDGHLSGFPKTILLL